MIAKEDLKIGMKVITIDKTNKSQGTSFKEWLRNSGGVVGIIVATTLETGEGDVGINTYEHYIRGTSGRGMYFMLADLVPWSENAEWYWTNRFKEEGRL